MGLAIGFLSHYESLPPEMRLLLTTGFLGGLTTFSTFSAETATMILREQYGWTAVTIAAHVIGSILMTLVGAAMIGMLLKR
jgi:CrcB protein